MGTQAMPISRIEQDEIDELRKRLGKLTGVNLHLESKAQRADLLQKRILMVKDYFDLVRLEPGLTTQERAILEMVENYLEESEDEVEIPAKA